MLSIAAEPSDFCNGFLSLFLLKEQSSQIISARQLLCVCILIFVKGHWNCFPCRDLLQSKQVNNYDSLAFESKSKILKPEILILYYTNIQQYATDKPDFHECRLCKNLT